MQDKPINPPYVGVSSSIRERFGALSSACIVCAFLFSLVSIGGTGAYFSDDTISPANAFAAGVWDDPQNDPTVELSAPLGFSLVQLPDAPPDPGDTGDGSSTPADVPPDDASSTLPIVEVSDPVTTIDMGDTGSTTPDAPPADNASSTPDDSSQ